MNEEHVSLVEMATRGEEVAIESLLRRHMPGLRAFIRLRASRAIRDRESCSDLAQSVCRELLQDLDRYEYRGEAAFRGWLFTAALSKIRDRNRFYAAQKRAAGREKSLPSQYYSAIFSPSRVAMGREEILRLEDAFDLLPDDYREVISLARVAGLTHREIAERMQRSEAAVTALLSRAMKRLSWVMTRSMPPPEGHGHG